VKDSTPADMAREFARNIRIDDFQQSSDLRDRLEGRGRRRSSIVNQREISMAGTIVYMTVAISHGGIYIRNHTFP
jgi:hypothetical protein